MARARIALTAAYVLTARPYQDSSLLVEIFSRDHGRVGLVARGARGPRSRYRALLQPLQPLLLSWTEAGGLGTLTGAEADGPAHALGGEPVFYAWYLNELLLKLLQRHDPHPALYEAYARSLAGLCGARAEAQLRYFELDLLAELGYALWWPEDLQPGAHYRFDPEHGPQAAPAGADSYPAEILQALAERRLEQPAQLTAARRLLREALRVQLQGRELQTPRLLRALRARAGRS